MKHIVAAILVFLIVTSVYSEDDCGSNAIFDPDYEVCTYRCTDDGVVVDCTSKGCKCNDLRLYYNLDTKECSKPNCPNMDCAGRENEYFFTKCESGSRERCTCSNFKTYDCRRGCMCKNGFCRQDGKCIKRDCEHPFFQRYAENGVRVF